MVEMLSRLIRKYAFSKEHGTPFALFILTAMALLFIYGAKGQLTDIDHLEGGFALSFGFALATYAALYALGNFPYIFAAGMSAYGIGSLFPDPSLPRDIFYAAGGIAMLIIFIKWASAIKNPTQKVHRDDYQ